MSASMVRVVTTPSPLTLLSLIATDPSAPTDSTMATCPYVGSAPSDQAGTRRCRPGGAWSPPSIRAFERRPPSFSRRPSGCRRAGRARGGACTPTMRALISKLSIGERLKCAVLATIRSCENVVYDNRIHSMK